MTLRDTIRNNLNRMEVALGELRGPGPLSQEQTISLLSTALTETIQSLTQTATEVDTIERRLKAVEAQNR